MGADNDGAARAARFGDGALLLLAFLVYAPALGAGWIWDDAANVTECAPVLSPGGLRAIWLEPGATQQWFPLTYTLYWLEHAAWGLRPAGFHAVTVLLHALAAVLLARLLRRLGLGAPAAWLGAALFALHPVHVETVAWVSETKSTLSLACALGSALCWTRFAGLARDGSGGEGSPGAWAASLLLGTAAVLSKAAVVALPPALLVVAWWRRGHVTSRDVLSLVPLLGAALVASLAELSIEGRIVDRDGAATGLSALQRIGIAGRAAWFYPAKLALPVGLAPVYPRWDPGGGPLPLAAAAAAAALPAALLLLRGRMGRGPAAAVLLYGGTILPVLGLVDFAYLRYSFVADHFAYQASVPLLALAGCGLAGAAGSLDRVRPGAGRAAAGAVLLALGALASARVPVFRDPVRLWSETVRVHPEAWGAWARLGREALDRGLLEEAEGLLRKALAREPERGAAWNDLGVCLLRLGRPRDAAGAFERAVPLLPSRPEPRQGLGAALLAAGDTGRAEAAFRDALAVAPGSPVARSGLSGALARRAEALAAEGRFSQAAALVEEALALGPGPDAEAALRRRLEAHRRGRP